MDTDGGEMTPMEDERKKKSTNSLGGVFLNILSRAAGEKTGESWWGKKAPTRIELVHKGFADLSLTAWVRRR